MTKKEADPTYAPFVDEMVRVYEATHGTKYLFNGGKDGMALKRLLAISTKEEILSVWAKGLTTDKEFDRVHNFAELAGKWSRLVAKPAGNPHVYREPQKRPEGVCARCGGAPYGVTWRVPLCLECWVDWDRDFPVDTSQPPFPPGHLESQCAKYETWTREWATKGRP